MLGSFVKIVALRYVLRSVPTAGITAIRIRGTVATVLTPGSPKKPEPGKARDGLSSPRLPSVGARGVPRACPQAPARQGAVRPVAVRNSAAPGERWDSFSPGASFFA